MSVLAGANNVTISGGHFTASPTTNVASGGLQNDIVAFLHSHSATAGLLDAKERFDAPKCDEGTRASMIHGMKKFVQDGSSSGLYWLHGPAGVGKSALAQSLSLSLNDEGDHAASFFFSRTSPGRNDGNRLIVTLAYQLAMAFPALQPFMSKVVQRYPGIITASNAIQMKGLIVDPINKWHKKYNWSIRRWTDKFNNVKPYPRLILVDGLDECSNRNVQIDLILCIASAVRQLSTPLRFVITSRPESHILSTFELNPAFQGVNGVSYTKKNLGEDEEADEQITTFLLKEFAEIRRTHPIRDFLPSQWPRPDQIGKLVSKSSKGFIYPATVIRYIKMPHNRPDECLDRILGLSEIPTSDKPYELLDSLYHHIFRSVPKANQPSIHNIFHFLVLPSSWKDTTKPAMIEQHFGYPRGHVQHVLCDLLCLVEFIPDGHIKILHASLPDFLLDEARSGSLYIDVGNAHAAVAGGYLSSICSGNELPSRSSGFTDFLDHIMQANMSNALLRDKILHMNILPRSKGIRSRELDIVATRWEVNPHAMRGGPQMQAKRNIEGVAFLIAYLLVLVIRHGPEDYIRDQVAAVKAYILELYPAIGDVRAVNRQILPAMIPLFRSFRTSGIYHESIKHIFACKITPSQHQLREDIFELHFLMMAQLCQHVIGVTSRMRYPYGGDQTDYPEQTIERSPNFWANIVHEIAGMDPPC